MDDGTADSCRKQNCIAIKNVDVNSHQGTDLWSFDLNVKKRLSALGLPCLESSAEMHRIVE